MAAFRASFPSPATVFGMLFLLLCRPMPLLASAAHEIESDPLGVARLLDADSLSSITRLLSSLPSPEQLRKLQQAGTQQAAGARNLLQTDSTNSTKNSTQSFFRVPDAAIEAVNSLGPGYLNMGGIATGYNTVVDGAAVAVRKLAVNPLDFLGAGPLSPVVRQALDGGLVGPDGTALTSAQIIATLLLLSAIFNTVAAICYTISGGLATLAASLGLIPATWALVANPAGFALSVQAFASTVISGNKAISDTFYTRWSGALTQLADTLAAINDGSIRAALVQYRSDLRGASSLLETASANPLFSLNTGSAS